MITFEPFWATIKKRGVTQYDLYTHYNISRNELYRLRHNRNIQVFTVNRLCNLLDCGPEDVLRFTRDEDNSISGTRHEL